MMILPQIRENQTLNATQTSIREKYYKNHETSVPRYKFQSFDKLKFLSSEKLYISDPAKFNDPFDLRLDIKDDTGISGFPIEALQGAFSMALKLSPEINEHWFYDAATFEVLKNWAEHAIPLAHVVEAIQNRFSKFGVACFSSEWNSPLMWAHYGNSHRGVCLQYFMQPRTLVRNQNTLLYPVNYTTILPSIPLTEALFAPRNVGQRILATKSIEWAYEKEWRLVHLSTKGDTAPLPQGIELGSIIVGLSASAEDRLQAFQKGVELQVPVFQVDRSYDGYGFLWDATWPS